MARLERNQRPKSLREFLAPYPPALVLAAALGSGRIPSVAAAVKASGLPRRTFTRISSLPSFDSLRIWQADAFWLGTGIDMFHHRWLNGYLRRVAKTGKSFRYMRNRKARLRRLDERLAIRAESGPD